MERSGIFSLLYSTNIFQLEEKYNVVSYVRRTIKTALNLITDFNVLYYIIYGFTAVVGVTIKSYFFAFHLFDVLVRYPELLNVVRSVYNPRKPLILTYFLMIILIYVFTLFSYYFINNFY